MVRVLGRVRPSWGHFGSETAEQMIKHDPQMTYEIFGVILGLKRTKMIKNHYLCNYSLWGVTKKQMTPKWPKTA